MVAITRSALLLAVAIHAVLLLPANATQYYGVELTQRICNGPEGELYQSQAIYWWLQPYQPKIAPPKHSCSKHDDCLVRNYNKPSFCHPQRKICVDCGLHPGQPCCPGGVEPYKKFCSSGLTCGAGHLGHYICVAVGKTYYTSTKPVDRKHSAAVAFQKVITNFNSGNANAKASGPGAAGGAAAGNGIAVSSVAGIGNGHRASTATTGTANNVLSNVAGSVHAPCFPFCGSATGSSRDANTGDANARVAGSGAVGGAAAGNGNAASNVAGVGNGPRESAATSGSRNNVGSNIAGSMDTPCFPFCSGGSGSRPSTQNVNTGDANIQTSGAGAAGGAAAGNDNSVSNTAGVGNGSRTSKATSGSRNNAGSNVASRVDAACFPFCGSDASSSANTNTGNANMRVSGPGAAGGAASGNGNAVSNVAGVGNGPRSISATSGSRNSVASSVGTLGHRRLLRTA